MSDRAAVRFSMTCQRAETAVSKFRRPAVNIYEAYKRKEVDLMEVGGGQFQIWKENG